MIHASLQLCIIVTELPVIVKYRKPIKSNRGRKTRTNKFNVVPKIVKFSDNVVMVATLGLRRIFRRYDCPRLPLHFPARRRNECVRCTSTRRDHAVATQLYITQSVSTSR